MVVDPPDLVAVLVLLDQLVPVLPCPLLPHAHLAGGPPGDSLPHPEVHVLGAGEEVVGVDCELDRRYHLHPLGVVDLPADARVEVEEAEGPVEGAACELPAR